MKRFRWGDDREVAAWLKAHAANQDVRLEYDDPDYRPDAMNPMNPHRVLGIWIWDANREEHVRSSLMEIRAQLGMVDGIAYAKSLPVVVIK